MTTAFMSVLCALVPVFAAAGSTNTMSRWPSPEKVAAARTPDPRVSPLRIAPNTPAFDAYGLGLMLQKANEVMEKWKLEPTVYTNPLTLGDVTFTLTAEAGGISGTLSTKNKRYLWRWEDNCWTEFVDVPYAPQSFRYKDEEMARLAKLPSRINAAEAEAMARNYLHALGLSEKELELSEPPEVNQHKFQDSDGTVYPLPVFNVAWHNTPRPHAGRTWSHAVVFDISGITKQVAQYLDLTYARRCPLPTNYADMLNVMWPTNELQKRGLAPWPPRRGGEYAPAAPRDRN